MVPNAPEAVAKQPADPVYPSQAPYVPPPQIGPGGENPAGDIYLYPTQDPATPTKLLDESTIGLRETEADASPVGKWLLLGAIGLLTGVWLIS
jgi:hypothetical protein